METKSSVAVAAVLMAMGLGHSDLLKVFGELEALQWVINARTQQ